MVKYNAGIVIAFGIHLPYPRCARPSAVTEEALKRIGELYTIEADIRGMPAGQHLAERQQKAKPRLKSLESWLREKMKTLSRHS